VESAQAGQEETRVVKSAILEHLGRLERLASLLRGVIDAEKNEDLVPSLQLCRLAVDVDGALSRLQNHLDVLANSGVKRL
jgi:hypothetical protein